MRSLILCVSSRMIILHGDNQIASRQFYLDAKSRAVASGRTIVELVGSTLDQADMTAHLQTSSLWGQTASLFVDNFFTSRPSDRKKQLTAFFLSQVQSDITIWENQDVSASLKSFPPSVSKKFDLPKHIFTFLDTLSLVSLQLALSQSDPEFIFSLLVTHVQRLIQATEGLLTLPAWQTQKYTTQSQRLTRPKLLQLHSALLAIDYQQKSGAAPTSLASALELTIALL